jgi:hypothetical protein
MTSVEFLAAIQAAVTELNGSMTIAQFQAAVAASYTITDDQTIDEWQDAIETAIAAAATSIQTVKFGYLHELQTGQTLYDVLLIIPPRYEVTPRQWCWRSMDVRWMLIRQNKGALNDLMTDAERLTAWTALDAVNKALITKLQENLLFQIIDKVMVEYNSGSQMQLLPDNVVWIDVSFKVRINDAV